MPTGLFGLAAYVTACHPSQPPPPAWLVEALAVSVVVLVPLVSVMTLHAIGRAATKRQATRGPIFPI